MYLTPDRLRTMGLGIDVSDQTPTQMRSAIQRASSLVDTFCSVPMIPARYSFRGGTVVDETHQMRIDAFQGTHPFQFWPNFGPVRSISLFRIYSTNDIYVEIDPSNIVINNNDGYFEVASLNLTAFGIFGAGMVPLLGLYYPVAKWTLEYGYRFVVVDEDAEATDGRTYSALNQFWTDDDVTVKVDGVVVTTDFTINRTEGYVRFDANQAPDTVVQLSYTHPVPTDIQSATAIIIADLLGEADLIAKGMGGLEEIQVQDVRLRRPRNAERDPIGTPAIPDDAAQLLGPWSFVTIR